MPRRCGARGVPRPRRGPARSRRGPIQPGKTPRRRVFPLARGVDPADPMAEAIVVRREGGTPERLPLFGVVAAGGSPRDGLRIDGAPEAALLLRAVPAGVVVEARAGGARVAGKPLAEGGRRLLRPGETAEYLGRVLELPADPAPDCTRALAARILREAAAGGTPLAGAHLLVIEGPEAGRRIPLGEVETLGRGRGASARITDPLASRQHARIRRRGGGYSIEDLGSKNGARVNGVLLAGSAHPLRHGDEISIGSVLLVLCHPGPASGPGAGPPPGGEAAGALPTRKALGTAGAALLLASALALGLAALG